MYILLISMTTFPLCPPFSTSRDTLCVMGGGVWEFTCLLLQRQKLAYKFHPPSAASSERAPGEKSARTPRRRKKVFSVHYLHGSRREVTAEVIKAALIKHVCWLMPQPTSARESASERGWDINSSLSLLLSLCAPLSCGSRTTFNILDWQTHVKQRERDVSCSERRRAEERLISVRGRRLRLIFPRQYAYAFAALILRRARSRCVLWARARAVGFPACNLGVNMRVTLNNIIAATADVAQRFARRTRCERWWQLKRKSPPVAKRVDALEFALRFLSLMPKNTNQSLHFIFAISLLSFVHFFLPEINYTDI